MPAPVRSSRRPKPAWIRVQSARRCCATSRTTCGDAQRELALLPHLARLDERAHLPEQRGIVGGRRPSPPFSAAGADGLADAAVSSCCRRASSACRSPCQGAVAAADTGTAAACAATGAGAAAPQPVRTTKP